MGENPGFVGSDGGVEFPNGAVEPSPGFGEMALKGLDAAVEFLGCVRDLPGVASQFLLLPKQAHAAQQSDERDRRRDENSPVIGFL